VALMVLIILIVLFSDTHLDPCINVKLSLESTGELIFEKQCIILYKFVKTSKKKSWRTINVGQNRISITIINLYVKAFPMLYRYLCLDS